MRARLFLLVITDSLEGKKLVEQACLEALRVHEGNCGFDEAFEVLRELKVLLVLAGLVEAFDLLVGSLALDHFQFLENGTFLVDAD